MEIEKTNEVAPAGIKEQVEKLKSMAWVLPDKEERAEQYEVTGHKIFKESYRKKRRVISDKYSESGQKMFAADGTTPLTEVNYEERVRIGLAIQKDIVDRRAMFITGGGVEVEGSPSKDSKAEKTLLEMVLKTYRDNKIKFKLNDLACLTMGYGEAAAVFYLDKAENYWGETAGANPPKARIKMVIRSRESGDTFYPVFNQYRDLVAFGIGFQIEEEGKKRESLDIYTDEEVFRYREQSGGWVEETPAEASISEGKAIASRKHGFGKIPVAYFRQENTEWGDVQWLIERLEDLYSDHGETNIAFGNPILKTKGAIVSMMQRNDTAKLMELHDNADAEYLKWDTAPESIRLEHDNLLKMIDTLAKNAKTSVSEIKGIGQLSAAAIRLMFLDPHAAARKHQEGAFGESVQRMVNIIKAGILNISPGLKEAASLDIEARFSTYIPKNEVEELQNQNMLVNTLVNALNSDLISQPTAIKAMPADLVPDPEEELKPAQEQRAEKNVTITY